MERNLMLVLEHIKLWHRALKYRWIADTNEISYLLRSIPKGTVAFDIGAHKGGYTLWMKKAVGKKGLVVAFEPQEKGAALLKKLFNGRTVRVEHLAVSDKEEQLDLYIQPQSYAISFEASLQKQYAGALVETVNTVSIDGYCSDHGLVPSFIKIDVEGHEYKVISGAVNTLQQHHPVLLVEVEHRHIGTEGMEAVFGKLEELGYSGYFFRKGKKTPLGLFDPAKDQDPSLLGSGLYANNFVFEHEK